MHFSRLATVVTLVILTSTGLACQCLTDGKVNNGQSRRCCRWQDGHFIKPSNCHVKSIHAHLRQFRECCGGHSDCEAPAV